MISFRTWRNLCGGEAFSAVRQEVLLDGVAVGLEHGRRAAQVANLLLRPLDHAVLLAALGVEHLAGAGDLEALLRARLGLQLGHLALLNEPCGGLSPVSGSNACCLSKANRHGSPNGRAVRRRRGIWQSEAENATILDQVPVAAGL